MSFSVYMTLNWMVLEYKHFSLGFVDGLHEGYKVSEIIEFAVCKYVYFLQEKWHHRLHLT